MKRARGDRRLIAAILHDVDLRRGRPRPIGQQADRGPHAPGARQFGPHFPSPQPLRQPADDLAGAIRQAARRPVLGQDLQLAVLDADLLRQIVLQRIVRRLAGVDQLPLFRVERVEVVAPHQPPLGRRFGNQRQPDERAARCGEAEAELVDRRHFARFAFEAVFRGRIVLVDLRLKQSRRQE